MPPFAPRAKMDLMRLATASAVLVALLFLPSQKLAPYVATPEDVVDRMLALAKVNKEDVVYDLGWGTAGSRLPPPGSTVPGASGSISIRRSLPSRAPTHARQASSTSSSSSLATC